MSGTSRFSSFLSAIPVGVAVGVLVSCVGLFSEGPGIFVLVFVGADSTVIDAGLKILKNLLLRFVNLPDPSTLIMY